MELIADILLAAGALGAGFYCYVLGRRLKRFNDLEKGVGGAVAVLSAQVDDLSKTLTAAQTSAVQSAKTLTDLVNRAEETARRLELQMASLHDIPDMPEPAKPAPADTPAVQSASAEAVDPPAPDGQAENEQLPEAEEKESGPPLGPMFVRRSAARKAG